ncbi:pyridoxal-dependent decarboxylase, exosortase A system-associated [Pseudomaricurvus alkylphenolicus]|uniref:pyridoxal-dependent decarboxylase, exosortase A system-associated n=1 Tax=Pseudomaricurvus alkylphenolicus TaxID=1306991 RepID=UPI00141E15D4|nr:pyridoxal-dependent decarboxylase, exosortase A system-associated [Pseudomaricurvus alkylphenolicus]NIB43113.1 pyridoxal-dependent decarboxylase, exosortase A system-associated [Pseudomaricurvus alkylphenolicus]
MKKSQRTHVKMRQFPVRNNVLCVNDTPITEIARQIGHTPFYVYDKRLITSRIQELRKALPPQLQLHYAIKANPMAALVNHISTLVDGLDIASLGEMRIAEGASTSAENVSFSGPGKSNEELREALASGITINIESQWELQRLLRMSQDAGKVPSITIRVNPDFEVIGSGMRMGGGARPFGIDTEKIPQVVQEVEAANVNFLGFHIYWGSQNLCVEHILAAQKSTLDLARRLSQFCSKPIRLLNIGGGLGIPYFPGDQHLDLESIGSGLGKILQQYPEFNECNIIIELGRYIVGEAGLYVCEIIDRKESRGETFLITNGGLHHHLAASGNFGQIIRKDYPVCIGNRMQDSNKEKAVIVGPLCTPLDILANKIELPKAGPGDLVVVYQSGAYGLTASPQDFLSHPRAGEVLL